MPEDYQLPINSNNSNNPIIPYNYRQRTRLKRYEISEASTPNYQFALWLKEWYEEAASRDSKLQFAYRKVRN